MFYPTLVAVEYYIYFHQLAVLCAMMSRANKNCPQTIYEKGPPQKKHLMSSVNTKQATK